MALIVAVPRGRAPCGTACKGLLLAMLLALLPALPGCAWLQAKQSELALRPTPGRPADFAPGSAAERANFKPGDRRYALVAGDGSGEQVALWWLPKADAKAPVLLYLHGTFRNLYGNLPKINALREAGFAVLAVDYRGWGESTVRVPDEASIAADAALAFAELRRLRPAAAGRVIYGHSMGGAVAVSLAATLHGGTDYGALVLESTFTRLPDVAAEAGFLGRIGAAVTTLQFDSLSRIGRIDAPQLLMLHGDADRTVPIVLGRRLRDAAPPGRATWVEVPGGSHSRLFSDAPELYQKTFRQLIANLPAAP